MITFDGHVLKIIDDMCACTLYVTMTQEQMLHRLLDSCAVEFDVERVLSDIVIYLNAQKTLLGETYEEQNVA